MCVTCSTHRCDHPVCGFYRSCEFARLVGNLRPGFAGSLSDVVPVERRLADQHAERNRIQQGPPFDAARHRRTNGRLVRAVSFCRVERSVYCVRRSLDSLFRRARYFRGRKVHGDWDIRVEQAEFKELQVCSSTEHGTTVSMTLTRQGNKVKQRKTTVVVRRREAPRETPAEATTEASGIAPREAPRESGNRNIGSVSRLNKR